MSCQQFWFEYGVLRTAVVEKISGGPSHVMRLIMHLFFIGVDNFTTAGVYANCVNGPGETIFARNGGIIADRKAHMETFDLKGASGMVPCNRCANVVMKGAFEGNAAIPNPDGRAMPP